MTTFADRVRNLPYSPLAMAGLGLLSMPTRSRYPLSPMQFALAGAQSAYDAQAAQAEQAYREQLAIQQAQEFQQRQAEFAFRQEQAARAQAAQEARQAAISALPPEFAKLAALSPQAAAQAFAAQQFPAPVALPNSAREFEYARQNPQFAAYLQSQRPAAPSEPMVQVQTPQGPVWMPRSRAVGMPAAGEGVQGPKLSDVAGLRKEFNTLSKPWVDTKSAYQRIESSRPTAAGDLSMIFGFMKMLDPGSVVREGEQASASNAAGVPDRIRNTYNGILSGQRLTPEQRQDFQSQAKAYLQDAAELQMANQIRYGEIATRNGIRVEDVVTDFVGERIKRPKDDKLDRIEEGIRARRRGRLEAMQPSVDYGSLQP